MFNLFPALVWGQSNSSDFSWSGRWQHTDIDWFWFYSSLPLPPQTDNLLHCSTSNYSTFSWHYYGQSDPALADPNFPPLIKDYINWEARVQPIGGPCWAHADSLVFDIKYKIYHNLYDQRTLTGPCNLTENLESPGQNCNFNNPLPHFSEESILSARTYYTDYSEADNDLPHLDPYYFGRALSALGGGNIFLSPHINEIRIYPRSSATYNYRPLYYLKSVFTDYDSLNLTNFGTYTRFSQPSFRNFSNFYKDFHDFFSGIPYARIQKGQVICGHDYESGCYENIKRALACGIQTNSPNTISHGPLRVGVFAQNGVRNTPGTNHGNILIGWIDKTIPSGAANPDFEDVWASFSSKDNKNIFWTAPNGSGGVVVLDATAMKNSAQGILIGLEHAGNIYFRPYVSATVPARGYLPAHGDENNDLQPITSSICGTFPGCFWGRDQCRCSVSFFKGITLAEIDYSNFYPPQSDFDYDGIPDYADNCPQITNPLQRDLDNDGAGDLCDLDADGDGVINQKDGDPYNAYIGPDLNGNGYYEISWTRFHSHEIVDFDSDNQEDLLSDQGLGVGYNIIWNPDDFFADPQVITSLKNDYINECKNKCEDIYSSINEIDECKNKCNSLEVFHPGSFHILSDLPQEHSFACVYQNYFHPRCLHWVKITGILEKIYTYYRDAIINDLEVDPALDSADISILNNYTFSEIEYVFSDSIGKGVKLHESNQASAEMSNFRNLTLENLEEFSTNVILFASSKITPFQAKILTLFSHLIQITSEVEIENYETQVINETPNRLGLINPCDLVHQASLFTFTELKEGIESYCLLNHPSNSVERQLCEQDFLIFWDSWAENPQGGSVNAFSTWLEQMESICQGNFSFLPEPIISAKTTVKSGVGNVQSGGLVPIYKIFGIAVEFRYDVLIWNNSGWVQDNTTNIEAVKVAGCPCVGDDFLYQECEIRCERATAPAQQPAAEPAIFDGLYYNQKWDPVHSQDAAAYSGIDPKWIEVFDPQYHQLGTNYFKNKQIPSNQPGELFFIAEQFRDYDKALHNQELPSQNPVYKLLKNQEVGEFTPRISQQVDPDDVNNVVEQIYHRYYGQTITIDESVYWGVLKMYDLVNWNQSPIKIIPHIAQGGYWTDPLSPWYFSDWMLTTSDSDVYLLQKGTNHKIKQIDQLFTDRKIQDAAVIEIPSFHGVVALQSTKNNNRLEKLLIFDQRNNELQEVSSLTGLRKARILFSEGKLMVAGIRKNNLQIYSVDPGNNPVLKQQIPRVTDLSRINGTPDRVVVKQGAWGRVLELSESDYQEYGWLFAPGPLRGASTFREGIFYGSGPFLFSINNEFSPFSLQFYPKVGLPDHNLRKFEFATALVPHLAGDNKFNYFWDENQGTWKETELIMEVTP